MPRRRLGPPHALRAAARPTARSPAAAAAASPPWRGEAAEGQRLRGYRGGRSDGGSSLGSEVERARARLCQHRTRRSLTPDPALAVKSLLIGGSETGAGWPRQNGRLLALLGPALARLRALARLPAWGARPGLTVTVSLMAREMCAPRQRT